MEPAVTDGQSGFSKGPEKESAKGHSVFMKLPTIVITPVSLKAHFAGPHLSWHPRERQKTEHGSYER